MDLSTKLITLLGQHGQEVIQALTADFSSLSQEDKEKKAAAIRSKCAWAVAGITPIPIPFADIWTLTPIQMAMVRAIGNIYGYKLSEETVKEVFAVIAGGIVGQQVCLALFKIGLPGAGGFGGAAFAFAWTHGIGIAAELYFKKDGDVSAEELEAARKEGAMEGKQQHQAGEGNQKFKLGLTDSEGTLRGCVLMLFLGGVLSAPLSHAEYNAFRLGEAAGWYVGVHHVLSAIKHSPCGYVMRKDYDVGSVITEVKRYLRNAEKREFEATLRSQDFKQQLRDLENTFIYEPLEAGKRDQIDTNTMCGMISSNLTHKRISKPRISGATQRIPFQMIAGLK